MSAQNTRHVNGYSCKVLFVGDALSTSRVGLPDPTDPTLKLNEAARNMPRVVVVALLSAICVNYKMKNRHFQSNTIHMYSR